MPCAAAPSMHSRFNLRTGRVRIAAAAVLALVWGSSHSQGFVSALVDSFPPLAAPDLRLLLPQGLRPDSASHTAQDDYGGLPRRFDRDVLINFFTQRPTELAFRWGEIISELGPVWSLWNAEEALPEEQRTAGKQLRDALAKLGPVFVKIGQTLSQRPDLIGNRAADELKILQQANKPFSNEEAFSIVLEDLEHAGPLMPGGFTRPGGDPLGEPLFRAFSEDPIAAASLGQVYKAETNDGRKVAVKVQRPGSLRQVALDWTCWALGLAVMDLYWGGNAELSKIADEVAEGVFKELDYHNEAANAELFLKKHRFLPFVTAPRWLPEYSGPKGVTRVLTLEWIQGRSLEQIKDPEERVRMVDMAVEACVSSLVFTGFVHADPHEGNMLVTDDGRLAFLDFGLMGTVQPKIMEGFAAGIQHLLAEDWLSLARVFQEVEFIPKPEDGGFKKVVDPDARVFTYEPCTDKEFAAALEEQMKSEDGGLSRFGAIATSLTKLSKRYHMQMPPYIILFIRTFLTLEGIAGVAKPGFNIYEASLPYALQRALSPQTDGAVKALRHNLVTEAGTPRWDVLSNLLAGASADAAPSETTKVSDVGKAAEIGTAPGADTSAYQRALAQVLAASEGKALRRILADLDPSTMLRELAFAKGREIRTASSKALADQAGSMISRLFKKSGVKTPIPVASQPSWLVSEQAQAFELKQSRRRKGALAAIFRMQGRRLMGPSGAVAGLAMVMLLSRVLFGAALRIAGVPRVLSAVRGWASRSSQKRQR